MLFTEPKKMRLAASTAFPLLLAAACCAGVALAKVGKTKLSPDGLETSEIGLGALHFAELDGTWVCGLGAVQWWNGMERGAHADILIHT